MLVWWVLAGTVGFSVGFPAGLTIGKSLLWGWVVGGGIASVPQWFVLRAHVARAGWWVLASMAGLAIGSGASFLLSQYALQISGLTAAFAIAGATVGLGVGVAQWVKLRLHFRRAAWWVPASTAGYMLGVLAAVNAPVALPESRALIFGPEFGGLVGSISGVFTGITMAWLLSINANTHSIRRTYG